MYITKEWKEILELKGQVCIAITLVDQGRSEWLLAGTEREIYKKIRGDSDATLYFECVRPVGTFFADFLDSEDNGTLLEIADLLREAYIWSQGGRKKNRLIALETELTGSELEHRAKQLSDEIWSKENLTKNFVILRIWKEYLLLCGIKTPKKYVDIREEEYYQYCFRYIYPFMSKEKTYITIGVRLQEDAAIEKDTVHHPDADMRVMVFYPSDKIKYEYGYTDYSLLGLKAYYRQRLETQNYIVAECKVCKKVFLAKSKKKELCSEECATINARTNRVSRREGNKALEFDRSYNREKKYWNDNRERIKKRNPNALDELEKLYEKFREEEASERKLLREGKQSIEDLNNWYQKQRRVLENYLRENGL